MTGVSRRWLLGTLGVPLTALLGACSKVSESTCSPGDHATKRPEPGTSDSAPSANVHLSRQALALSPDGAFLAAAQSADGKLLGRSKTWGTAVWSTARGKVLHSFNNGLTGALAWHPDGSLLAAGGPGFIEAVDVEGKVRWRQSGHFSNQKRPDTIRDLAFTADGSQLASLGSDGTVRLWSLAANTCDPGRTLNVRRLSPTSLSFAPDGAELVIVGPKGPPELWDPVKGRRIERMTQVKGEPYGVTHLPDGTTVIGTAGPAAVRGFGPSAFDDAPAPLSKRPLFLAVAADGRIAVGGQYDNQVMIWDPASGSRKDLPRVGGSVQQLTWSPDGKVLYGVSPLDGVVAWDGKSWRSFDLP